MPTKPLKGISANRARRWKRMDECVEFLKSNALLHTRPFAWVKDMTDPEPRIVRFTPRAGEIYFAHWGSPTLTGMTQFKLPLFQLITPPAIEVITSSTAVRVEHFGHPWSTEYPTTGYSPENSGVRKIAWAYSRMHHEINEPTIASVIGVSETHVELMFWGLSHTKRLSRKFGVVATDGVHWAPVKPFLP